MPVQVKSSWLGDVEKEIHSAAKCKSQLNQLSTTDYFPLFYCM